MIDEKELELLSSSAKGLSETLNEGRYVMSEDKNVFCSVDVLDEEEINEKIKEQNKVINVSKRKLERIRKRLKNSSGVLNIGEVTLGVSGLLPYLALFHTNSVNISLIGFATTLLVTVPSFCALFNNRIHEKVLDRLNKKLAKSGSRIKEKMDVANDNKQNLLALLEYENYLEFLKDIKDSGTLERFSDSFEVFDKNEKEKIISRIK